MHRVEPAVIVQPTSAMDVTHALRFATRLGLPVAVRGGGHSVAGNGTVADGMVIDLGARMRGVAVDPGTRVVTVEEVRRWATWTRPRRPMASRCRPAWSR